MITVYTLAYNEEVFLQFMIDHYRSRFPGCHIVVNDNQSTDRTKEIALSNNCEVVYFDTNNQIDDSKITELKNSCWKTAQTNWVLVCDVDELLNINEEQLKVEEAAGATVIRSEGWNMVNMEDNYDFSNIKHGCRVHQYDKSYLFKKSEIQNINYNAGGHHANPQGRNQPSQNVYKLYHYKCINPDYLVERFKWTAARLSQTNIKNGWGTYWLNQTEESIRAGFKGGREGAKNNKIID
jgi:hypothetical protein